MPRDRRRPFAIAAILLVLVLLVWTCEPADDDGAAGEATSTTEPPAVVPPAFVPITGGTNEDGQPEPPPIHAVFSVVVHGNVGWEPYAGRELIGLDEDAARAIGQRLRQLEPVLRTAGIPASIELGYGAAAALCEVDPEVLDLLERRGHRIGIHARTTGDAFRAHRALGACNREATTLSGLGSMADPHGPGEPTRQTLIDAIAVLSVLDVHQVTGRVAAVCTDLGLAEPAHQYGTGSFTAPWRSGWTEDAPCTDLASGRIVMIDQNPLVPAGDADRIGPTALSTLRSRTDQTFGYALDLRFREIEDLPMPGVITWGVTVRLDDLLAPTPSADDAATDTDSETEEPSAPIEPPDPRVAPLSEETLAALAEIAEELWTPRVEQGRLRWMLPDDVALLIRPMGS